MSNETTNIMTDADFFKKLYSTDVSAYKEEKNGLSYLSWANAWAEFKKVYPNCFYEIMKDENGICYFGDDDVGYMVYTKVFANGLVHEMWLPVLDGANKSMKKKPYTYQTKNGEKTVEAMTMFDVNKTLMRCLTKNLAMFGLGLYIYAGEDLPEDLNEYTCVDCGVQVDSECAKMASARFGVVVCRACGAKRLKKERDNE